jgi:Fe-S cluster assembly protein SufD
LPPLDRTTSKTAASPFPSWVAEQKAAGWAHYEKLDMPSPREELWRYVELGFDLADVTLPDEPGAPLGGDDVLGAALGETAGEAHVVDGTAVSVTESAHVTFTSLATSLAADSAALRAWYGSGISVDLDKFAAANHAFSTDGAFLHVPAGVTVSRPFYVDVQGVTPGTVSLPRVTVVLEKGADASLVINYRSPHDAELVVVPQIEAKIEDNARLKLTIVQNFGYATSAIAHARVLVGRDATLAMGEVGLGGDLGRLHLTVDLEGRGSSAKVMGAYFGEEDQTLDYRYFMHHAGTNTNSEMFLKGAVEDRALSVFTGMIRIDEEAQKTDAFQTNRNLILSDGAAAQSVPNLEILANDVRCGHGSTMGPLNAEQRYYLMSRGLPRDRADRLQVRGFFEEALRRLPEPGVAAPARDWINAKYVQAQEEGRV